MANKRLSKIFTIKSFDNATIKYGTMNKNNPQVVYMSIRTWIKPTFIEDSYVPIFEDTKRQIKNTISKFISENNKFSSKYILDFDINTEKLTYKTSKFMQLDVFFKQKDNNVLKINDSIFNSLFSLLSNDILINFENNDLSLSKTKNK